MAVKEGPWHSLLKEFDYYRKEDLEDSLAVFNVLTEEISRRLALLNEESEESRDDEAKGPGRNRLQPVEECDETEIEPPVEEEKGEEQAVSGKEKGERNYTITQIVVKKIRSCFRMERKLRKKAEEEKEVAEEKTAKMDDLYKDILANFEEKRKLEDKVDQLSFENSLLHKKIADLSESDDFNFNEVMSLEKQLYHAKGWNDELLLGIQGLKERLRKEGKKRSMEEDA